ncbi:MAG TPA: hypothetical protein VFE37_04235 [Chloroflexota bacterium]|nr:hypothetical protein [Chloroflexota bacterium]
MQRPISKTRRGGRVPSARPRLAWRLLLLALALAGAASLAPVAPVAAQEPEPPGEGHSPAWARARDGVQVAATAHFDVWAPGDDQALAATAARVAATAEAVLPTVEARLATPLADRVRLVLLPADQAPGPCEPRAATFPTRRRIVVFVGPATLDPKALPAFLAHELGHQLTLDRWGALGNDRRLSEGVATWAAEPYWLAWRGWSSMDQAAADLLAKSAIAPLAEPHEGCLVAAERDVYYSAWSSFVDFLARHYGWDRFGEALSLPPVADDHADYAAAFGRSLEDLTAAWEQELPRPDNAASHAPTRHGAGSPRA